MKSKIKLVTKYTVAEYECGLKAGDRVRLTRNVVVKQGKCDCRNVSER